MIKIELQEACYECKNFDLDIDESSETLYCGRGRLSERMAIVRCTKSDVCKHIEQDEEHER
ncbi:hypothetical protein [Eggerthella lenta]|jgi:hypothetical protein|uniref:hypothetical protein n=1 Tax=Eggerthella lenta TaxID=84112 RepID=UPI001EE10261|nr:hypothetical protein [Eggerthella lenta]MCG4515275.1 hypothetical protein [Eggerthella lenta]BDF40059.1 hypothetical protein CE91St33_01210 [Eggerthella lenta]DAM34098.1 MAG TPA: hypothetical protein [Caudoviricetes sp.]